MSRHDVLPPGTPCWVELSSGDPGEAARFYGALFDWRLEHEEYEGYGRFLRDGKIAAGLWPEETSGAAASWTVYFTVEASANLVLDAGGQVVVEPRELDGQGTLAGCLDPEGVFFMVWKSANWGCTELLGRPGCWGWTELFTRDPERAEDFYPRVFGWGRSREGDRVRWTVEGQVVAGMLPISPEAPAEACRPGSCTSRPPTCGRRWSAPRRWEQSASSSSTTRSTTPRSSSPTRSSPSSS